MTKWSKFLEEECIVPEEAGKVLETMKQDQVEVLIAFVMHYVDVCFTAFAMHWDTDATGFVKMLPEDERMTLLDVSDDVESHFMDSLRKFAENA